MVTQNLEPDRLLAHARSGEVMVEMPARVGVKLLRVGSEEQLLGFLAASAADGRSEVVFADARHEVFIATLHDGAVFYVHGDDEGSWRPTFPATVMTED